MKLNFGVFGPYTIPTLPRDNDEIDKKELNSTHWAQWDAEAGLALSTALGCYILSISGKHPVPWYVGKTEAGFKKECFNPKNLRAFEGVLRKNGRGKPQITLIVNVTPGGKLVKPSKNEHSQIDFLENYLIATCLRKNPDLCNSKQTRFVRGVYVPGLLNPKRGKPSDSAKSLAKLVGSDLLIG